MQQLIKQIEQWAEDRNLIHGSTPQKQMLKLMEEFGELCGGISKNKPDVIKDSVGDCTVVLIILNKQFNLENEFTRYANTFRMPEDYASELLPLDFTAHSGKLAETIWIYEDLSGYRKRTSMKHSIARCFGSLLALCNDQKLDITDCLQHAYDQIKDRKGKMIDGVFVKEGDL